MGALSNAAGLRAVHTPTVTGCLPGTAHPYATGAAAERQRIAGELHDDVSSMLFAMVASAARSVESGDPAEMREALLRTIGQASEVSARIRDTLRDCAPADPAEGIPVSARRDVEDFARRTGASADLLLRGWPREIDPAVGRAVLTCLRQALFNVERHAGARTVRVTVAYLADEVQLLVVDDGVGLPAGFRPSVLPDGDHHWGFTSMARRVERCGGEIELSSPPGGGTHVRVRIPT